MPECLRIGLRTAYLIALVPAASAALAWSGSAAADAVNVEAQRGTATFEVNTNVPAVRIHGESKALSARVRVRQAPEGMILQEIEATLPVKTITTRLGLRDEHMRKHVFTTSDGRITDLRFVADETVCSSPRDREPSSCEIAGELSIRDTPRPFTVFMKITDKKGAFHAAGEGVVRLSTYAIEQPSQLGVRTDDEVKLRLELTAKPSADTTTGAPR